MTTYTKTVDFAAKDALSTGNPSKLVKGTEIGAEFDNIATADATNAKKDSTNTFVGDQTITGNLNLSGDITLTGAGKGIVFEGTTADAFETTLVAGEPTADRTVTMPDATTTLAGLSVAQTFSVDQTFAGDIILTGAGKGVIFEGTTADAFETTLVAGEPTADRTVTMPDATTTLAGLAVTQTFTNPQRGTITTDNDLSFDLSVTNFWLCTPTAGGALTFTNIPSGQGGTIKLVNGSNYAITAAANTKVTSTFLATISATGTYIINYFSDGTDVHCSTAGASA